MDFEFGRRSVGRLSKAANGFGEAQAASDVFEAIPAERDLPVAMVP